MYVPLPLFVGPVVIAFATPMRGASLNVTLVGVLSSPGLPLPFASGVDPAADTVVAHAEHDYTTNVPLPVLVEEGLLAWGFDGRALDPEHGGPLRLLVPRLYFWKSAKWLRGLEWLVGDQPGYWERNGYHNDADPWREQRYWGD